MIDFNEFLVQFREEVEETFAEGQLSKNARIAVISTMRKHLGRTRFDPMELMQLFETMCVSAMNKGEVDRPKIADRFKQELPVFLTDEYETNFSDIVFEEPEERRSRGR